jgi:heme-degrading monooxygenase HmoA
MDGHVNGMLGRQVSVDRDRNTVIVWTTFERKSDLYDWLETDQGKSDHGEEQDMSAIIETFEMYDLEPVSGRL